MKKLTRREALKTLIKLWRWLARTGSRRKWEWPGWKPYPHCNTSDSPCCDYDYQHSGDYCGGTCLIKWPGGDCCSPASPYEQWGRARTIKQRKACARKIVKLAQEALDRLPRPRGKGKVKK